MSALAIDTVLQHEQLLQLSQLLRPDSVADAMALLLFLSATTAYFLKGKVWDKKDPYYHLYFERPQQQFGAGQARQRETRNIAQKLEEAGKDCVIFWGSQSGTAEGFANRLAKECHQRFGLAAFPADLSDYDPETIGQIPESKFAIFIVSTFGEGDPSDNTAGLWEWVQHKSDVSLENLRYAALGLGNSNYKYYNRVVDVVTEALDRLGARQLLPVARADDAEGATVEDFIAWKENLFTTLRETLKLEEVPYKYEPTLAILDHIEPNSAKLYDGTPEHATENLKTLAACSPIKPLSIKNSHELFVGSQRNCVHLELDLSEYPQIHYKTGDHLAIWPANPDGEVERLLAILGIQNRRDVPLVVESIDTNSKVRIPSPTTAATLLRHHLEICGSVSRDAIRGLADFAPNEAARAFVLELSRNREHYSTFLSHTHLNLGRLLALASADEPWISLPLSYVLETLPQNQPRYYSISSSSVLSPRRAAITVLVSTQSLIPQSQTAQPQTIYGVASNFLLAASNAQNSFEPSPSTPKYRLHSSDEVNHSSVIKSSNIKMFAHIRKSKFKLPALSSCPIIMVAAGTGLAPFRAFIAERAKMKSINKPVGEMMLFFGCRNPEEDYIYRQELDDMSAALNNSPGNETFRTITAFSRKQGEQKTYVQDRVQEFSADVLRLIIDGGANFYICGRASMAREVGNRVGEAARKLNGWSDSETKQWSEGLKKRGKWREDVWG